MIVAQTVTWILNAIMVASIIISVKLRNKTRKTIAEIIQSQKKRLEELESSISSTNDRVNLLSKENHKLREENEMLKERLRNMGIKDFDVI